VYFACRDGNDFEVPMEFLYYPTIPLDLNVLLLTERRQNVYVRWFILV